MSSKNIIPEVIQKIEKVKGKLIEKTFYDVPCWVENGDIIPIIPHLHSDKESGQLKKHYHVDDRFITNHYNKYFDNKAIYILTNNKDVKMQAVKNELRIYPKNGKIERHILRCVLPFVSGITPVEVLKNHKLKKCMHNGKCPHKGYDLSNIEAVNGVVTCPLHGLKINIISKEIVNDPKLLFLLKQLGLSSILDYDDPELLPVIEQIKEEYPNKYSELVNFYEKKKEHEQRLLLEPTNII